MVYYTISTGVGTGVIINGRVHHGAHDTEGLDALLARLGVDPDHLRDDDVRLIALLRRECAMCSDWTRCAHDIAAGAVHGAAPSYCPNRTTIETLAIGRRPYPRVV